MGTTADKLNKILETKEAIKQAIRDKGVYIGDYDAFAEYPDAIRRIETSSGEGDSDEFFNMRTQNGTDMSYLFYYYTGSELDVSDWDTSNVTDMSEMFHYCNKLTSLDLSNFNTSNVTNMASMFNFCLSLKDLNISNFNTNNVTNMKSIFYSCKKLISLDISNFNTSNVTDISQMFRGCEDLTILNLSNFNTSNVTDMSYMFSGCNNLTSLDLSNFDMSNVTKTGNMFQACNKLHTLRLDNCSNDTINKIITSSSFQTDAIEGVTRKIYCKEENAVGLTAPSNWVFEYVDDPNSGGEPEEPEIDIPLYVSGEFQNKTGLTEVTTMVNESHTSLSNMFDCCYNLATINGIEQWDTSNVTNMSFMFNYCQKLIELDLSSFNTSKVTTMYAMFRNCSNLEILDMRNFDMTNVTTDNFGLSMFDVCYELQELRLDNCSNDTISKIITSPGFPTGAILDVTRKIYVNPDNIGNLEAPKGWIFVDSDGNEIGEKPASPYEEGQFTGNGDITVANTLVTAEHKDLNGMFGDCTNLAVVDTSKWDTSKVMNMKGMFYNCENLPYLDLSSFNTSNVENMVNMFRGCTDLLYLDISNFTVGENCLLSDGFDSGMFWDCTSLLDLRLDNCYPDTIERIINSRGFQVNPNNVIEDLPRVVYVREENEYHLTLSDGSVFGYIEDPVYIKNKNNDKWDYIDSKEVVNVIVDTQTDFDRYEDNSLEGLFENCGSLRLINGIEQWNTTGIEYMSYMFAGCTHLVSLNLSSFDTSNVEDINNMFDGCTNLRYLDISNFIIGEESYHYNTSDMFRDCNNLKHLRLDNCDAKIIEKIIDRSNLPTGDIDGEKRKMYVKEANAINEWGHQLLAPDGWEFVYLVESKKEEE